MGDSCESGRPTFSLDKCVLAPSWWGAVASAKPDSQEASKRKRDKCGIVNDSPRVPLVPMVGDAISHKGWPGSPGGGTAGSRPPGDGWRRTPSGGAEGLETDVFSRAKYPRGTAIPSTSLGTGLAVVARASYMFSLKNCVSMQKPPFAVFLRGFSGCFGC
jgi:hypothetical protein